MTRLAPFGPMVKDVELQLLFLRNRCKEAVRVSSDRYILSAQGVGKAVRHVNSFQVIDRERLRIHRIKILFLLRQHRRVSFHVLPEVVLLREIIRVWFVFQQILDRLVCRDDIG